MERQTISIKGYTIIALGKAVEEKVTQVNRESVSNNSIRIELKLYELLGIKQFRRLVFKLEKWIHRKDGGENTNYHISSLSEISAKDFVKYLFYNGAIHVRNIFYFLIFCLIRYTLYPRFHPVDLLPIALTIKDIYCVMLQRYNYIQIQTKVQRIEEKRKRQIERKAEKIARTLERYGYDRTLCDNDLSVIRKLKNAVNNSESVVLGEDDRLALIRLSTVLLDSQIKREEE